MINVNFVKSTKVKVVSVMLSFVLLFLGIPALRLKAASDSEHIHDSTLARDTYITASSCVHTYYIVTSFQAPGSSFTHTHNGQPCTVTNIYNVYVLECYNCGYLSYANIFSHQIHTVRS